MNRKTLLRYVMRLIPLCFVFLVLIPQLFGLRSVSRDVPEIFIEHLEPMLTPVEEVLVGKDQFPDSDQGGILLLSERVDYISDEGVRYRALRSVYYTRTDAGISYNERDTISFDNERERIFLGEAYSLNANGERTDLDENATFIHSPQEEASNSLYTSIEELVLVYPGVKPGTVTAYTVYIIEDEPIIPETFMAARTFKSFWPLYRTHFACEMPESWRERLNIVQSGIGVPERVETKPMDGRSRLEWTSGPVEEQDYETRAPSWLFLAPTIRLSTLPDWDSLAAWFRDITEDRRVLNDDLKAEVEKITADLTTRESIISALASAVSDQVRYTGLELGLASFKPYDCNEVWAKKYGDCKDKSNLLIAMLNHKGIPAWPALLKTEYHGKIEKRSPSCLQFNHAIVAIPEDDGTYQFIDPTVEQLVPGELPISDNYRDILVMTDEGAVWAQSDSKGKNGYIVSFDLSLSQSGALSGWCEINSFGAEAAFMADSYNKRDVEDRLEYMHDRITSYYPDAQTFDVKYDEQWGPLSEHKVTGYLGTPSQPDNTNTIAFPYSPHFFPDFAAKEERDHPYRSSPLYKEIVSSITLPEGYTVENFPEPFQMQSDVIAIEASWRLDDEGKLVARLYWQPLEFAIDTDAFPAFRQAIGAIKSWIQLPVKVVEGASDSGTIADDGPTVSIDFPILSSGEGQLRLLDHKFPSGGDEPERRKALKQVLQWFPDDPITVATARAKLALMDWGDEPETAVGPAKEFKEILQTYGSELDTSTRSWLQYLQAKCEFEGDVDKTGAIEQLRSIREDTTVSNYRRGWSGRYEAEYVSEDDPEKALQIVKETQSFDSDAMYSLDLLRIELALKLEDTKEVMSALLDVQERGEVGDENLADMLYELEAEWIQLDKRLVDRLEKQIRSFISKTELGSYSSEASVSLIKQIDNSVTRTRLASDLEKLLARAKPEWWQPDHPAREMDLEEMEAAIEEAEEIVKLNLHMLCLFRQDIDFDRFAKGLFYLTYYIRRLEPESSDEILDTIQSNIHGFTLDSEGYVARTVERMSYIWEAQGKVNLASKEVRWALGLVDLEDWLKVNLVDRLMQLSLKLNDGESAMEAAARVEDILSTNKYGTDPAAMQILLHLANGERKEASEWLERLLELNDEWVDDSDFSTVSTLLFGFAEDTESLGEYWNYSDVWWDQWVQLCKKYGVSVFEASDILKIKNPEEWVNNISAQAKSGNEKAFLTELRPVIQVMRAVPNGAADLYGRIPQAGNVGSDFYKDLSNLFLAVSEDWTYGSDDLLYPVLAMRSAYLNDNERKEEALETAKRVYQECGTKIPAGNVALRVWVLAEGGLESGDEALREIESVLASENSVSDRQLSIRVLSDRYYLNEAHTSQRKLLEREKAFLEDNNHQSTLNILNQRVTLVESKELVAEFAKSWIEKHCDDWFATTWPSSLDDVERLQNGQLATFNYGLGVQAKVNMLTAMDISRPLDERYLALAVGMSSILKEIYPRDEYVNALLDSLEMDGLPLQTKASFWFQSVANLVEREDPAALDKILKKDLTDGIRADLVNTATVAHKFLLSWKKASPNNLVDCFDILKTEKVDMISQELISRLIQRLVYLGREEEARKVLESTSSMSAQSYMTSGLPALRLRWMQVLRDSMNRQEFNAGLRDLVVNYHDKIPKREPKGFTGGSLSYKAWNSWSTTRDCILYAYASGRFKGATPESFVMNLIDQDNLEKTSEFGSELMDLVLEVDSDPQLRIGRIYQCMIVDFDLEEFRESLTELLQKAVKEHDYEDEVKKTIYGLLGFLETRFSMEESPPNLFSKEAVVYGANYRHQLIYLINHDGKDRMLPVVNSLIQQGGLDYFQYYLCYYAYEQLGMDLESDFARQAAVEAINLYMRNDSLSMIPRWERIPSYCWAMGEPQLLPKGVRDLISRKIQRGMDEYIWQVNLCLLDEDWQGMVTWADKVVEAAPELYEMRGYRALALAQLGELEKASKDIEYFRNWCRSNILYLKILDAYSSALE